MGNVTDRMAGAAGQAMTGAAGQAAAPGTGGCASRSYEVQLLAARVAACADRADAALGQLAWLELKSWESPAGRAYRTALSLQAAALRRNRDAFQDAAAVVLRHAGEVLLSPGRTGP